MGMIIASVVIVVLALMFVIQERKAASLAKLRYKEELSRAKSLEEKVESVRSELRKSKEELDRGKTALKEARELTKKKLRLQSQSGAETQAQSEENMKAMDNSSMALSAMEVQIEQLKIEQQKNEADMKKHLEEENNKQLAIKAEEIEQLKKKLGTMSEEIKKKNRLMRPEGNKIDLKSLPDDIACEFARVYRKAEQHERLHGITRAKLHLAQEKFTELQKRYFSVCRELAVMAGKKEDIAAPDALEVAEKIVEQNEHSKV